MKFTTQILQYHKSRTCCVINFIARQVSIQLSFHTQSGLLVKYIEMPCTREPRSEEKASPPRTTVGPYAEAYCRVLGGHNFL